MTNRRAGAFSSAARAASRPASRARSSWWNSSSPTPSLRGLIVRSAWRRAASEVFELPSSSTRASVSPSARRAIAAERVAPALARACRVGAGGGLRVASGRSTVALTSTAMIGPSPSAAIAPTGRLSTSEPSTARARRAPVGGPRIGIAMLSPTRSHEPAPAMHDELAAAQVAAGAEEAALELLDRERRRTCARSIASTRSPRISEWRGSV